MSCAPLLDWVGVLQNSRNFQVRSCEFEWRKDEKIAANFLLLVHILITFSLPCCRSFRENLVEAAILEEGRFLFSSTGFGVFHGNLLSSLFLTSLIDGFRKIINGGQIWFVWAGEQGIEVHEKWRFSGTRCLGCCQ